MFYHLTVPDVHALFTLPAVPIAFGSNAEVYTLDRSKVVRIQSHDDDEKEILDEIAITQRLTHITPEVFLQAVDKKGGYLMVQKRMDASLHHHLCKNGAAHKDKTCSMIKTLLKKVALANVLWLDVKPGNMLLDYDDDGSVKELKAIDFGDGLSEINPRGYAQRDYTIMLLLLNIHLEIHYKSVYNFNDDVAKLLSNRQNLMSVRNFFLSDEKDDTLHAVWQAYVLNYWPNMTRAQFWQNHLFQG